MLGLMLVTLVLKKSSCLRMDCKGSLGNRTLKGVW